MSLFLESMSNFSTLQTVLQLTTLNACLTGLLLQIYLRLDKSPHNRTSVDNWSVFFPHWMPFLLPNQQCQKH